MKIDYFKFTVRPHDMISGIRLEMQLQAHGKSYGCEQVISRTLDETLTRDDRKALFERIVDRLHRELSDIMEKKINETVIGD